MSRVDVATQPQAIYQDGIPDSVTIRNLGPWTVYLDSDSSVGAQSYPLPPTATIVWDPGRPLWAVAPGGEQFSLSNGPNYSPSKLLLTRNSYQGLAPQAATVDRLFKRQGVNLTGGATFTMPTVETASYNTLFIQYNSADSGVGGGIPATDRSYEVFINWTDDNGRIVANDRYVSPSTSSLNLERGVVVTVPVKGARANIEFAYSDLTPPGTALFALEVYATSRVIRDRQDWMVTSLPGTYANAQSFNGLGVQTSYTGYYKQTNWDADYSPIFLNGIGNDIQLSIRVSTAVSTAGRIHVSSYYDPAIIFADFQIPVVASAQTIVQNLSVPISTPVRIVATPGPVTAGPVAVGIVWKDYNG